MTRYLFIITLAFLGLISPWVSAQAAPRDAFGLDAESAAQAMAVAAGAAPLSAAATNPAKLIDTRNIETSLGIAVADHGFKINRNTADLDTYVGYQFGVATQIPLGKYRDRLYFGANLHLPNDGLYEVDNTTAQTPIIYGFGADARRFTLDAALAVRIWERIAVGIGFHLIPDVTADVNIDFTQSEDASSSNVKVDYRFAPIVGIYAEPIDGLHLGFFYRAAARLSLEVPARVSVNSAMADINVRLLGYAYTEPHTIALGVRYDFSHLTSQDIQRFAAELDIEYRHYTYPLAQSAKVTIYDDNGEVIDESKTPYMEFHDAWAIRAALSWHPIDEITVFAGYAFQKSPIPAQRNVFNVLDSDFNRIAFGTTLWLPENWLGSFGLGFSTSAQFDIYATRDMEKYEFLHGNPGFPSIRFEGFRFAWHADILLRFE